jgi:3',5'-cyclic AMP phosphodiesterase CpdA
MRWAGTGVLWTICGGVPISRGISQTLHHNLAGELSFVQISDSHIGFSKEANKDVTATLQEAVAGINSLHRPPEFIVHTGDLSHLSKPDEFDTLDQVLKGAKTPDVFYVPGEHDVLNDNGRQFIERYGRGTKGTGWYSFDKNGVHFIGLVNVVDLKAGGLGNLGPAQLKWLQADLLGLSSSTPIVVFAHIPLWTVYSEWGWGTDDSAEALSYLRRFGSVTVLNGHIHQIMQKVEGNVSFHTAASTAFPQPKPGAAASPGPMRVPAGSLRDVLGITDVHSVPGSHMLAVVDSSLTQLSVASSSGAPAVAVREGGQNHVTIDNFSFTPAALTITQGATVEWTNRDDIPHNIYHTGEKFHSPVLDTDQKWGYTFQERGVYTYYCKIHPKMTGQIIVN